jgi:hypothetical protein
VAAVTAQAKLEREMHFRAVEELRGQEGVGEGVVAKVHDQLDLFGTAKATTGDLQWGSPCGRVARIAGQ